MYRKGKNAYGAHQKNAFSKMLWIPRTFPVKQEQILLDFLRQHRTIWQEHSAKDFASYESYKRAGILYVFGWGKRLGEGRRHNCAVMP